MLYHPLTGPLPPPLVLALCLPNLRPSQAFLFPPLKFHLERNPGRGPHPDLHLDTALKWSPGQAAGASGRLRTGLKTYCCSRERNDRGRHRGRGPREGPSERKRGHQTLHSKNQDIGAMGWRLPIWLSFPPGPSRACGLAAPSMAHVQFMVLPSSPSRTWEWAGSQKLWSYPSSLPITGFASRAHGQSGREAPHWVQSQTVGWSPGDFCSGNKAF